MRRFRHDGFSLIELLVTVAVIGIIAAMAVPALQRAIRRARTKALIADGRTLLVAFKSYNVDHDEYPPCCSPASEALDRSTLHPLTRDGYIKDGRGITAKLANGQLTSYDSPDLPSTNHDFYAVLTHVTDPTIVVLVADTDEFPGWGGTYFDGVFVIRGSQILNAADA